MIITKIEPQKKYGRVNIYLDGEFAFGLSEDLRYKYNLNPGNKIEKEFVNEILESEEFNKAIHTALNYLSYRQRTEKEVYTSLKSKGFDEDKIINAIDYCKSHSYIDDREFTKVFISDKRNLNKHGSLRIKQELIIKGVSQDIIDELLNIEWSDEYDTALAIAAKRIGKYKNDNKNDIYRKLGGFLYRRGYSYEIISKVLNELL